MRRQNQDFCKTFIPNDFDVTVLGSDKDSYLYFGQRRDVIALVKSTEVDDIHHGPHISQEHIPRFLFAEAIAELHDYAQAFTKERRKIYGEHGIRLLAPMASEIGIYSNWAGKYNFAALETKKGIPPEYFESDVQAYRTAKAKVVFKDGQYVLPRTKTCSGNQISAKSKRLIEAVAFERLVQKRLDETKFGIYSAFCTWKDCLDGQQLPKSLYKALIDSQFRLSVEASDGSFMDLALEVQDRLLSHRIWGPGIDITPDTASSILAEGMAKLTTEQLTQFALMNGMHDSGLFPPLATVLGLIEWHDYIEHCTQGYQPDSEFEQDLRADVAIIKMFGDLASDQSAS